MFFDRDLQTYKKLTKDGTHPDGLYYLVNSYGNVVATMDVYTTNFEKGSSKLLHEAKTTHTVAGKTPPAEDFDQTSAKKDGNKLASGVPMTKTKATALPQTGDTTKQYPLLGILLSLASLFTLVGFKTKKNTK